MARKTMWAVAGALLAFAPLASAANYGLDLNNPRIYASEVITGADVEIDYDGDAPVVDPWIDFGTGTDASDEITAIDNGDVLEVTITLHNAKFGENVKSSDMSPLFRAGSVTGCTARVRDVEGGAQGDSTVTFEVEANGNCAVGTAPHSINMPFELPTLEGLNARRSVTATVTTAAGGGSGWRGTSHSTTGSGEVCGTDISMARGTCVRLEDGVLTRLAPAAATRPQGASPLIRYVAGLTFTPSNGAVVGGNRVAAASIDLAGDRSSFVDDASAPLGSISVGVASAAACTTDDPIPAGCIRQTDGREFSIGRGGEGQGDLMVSVSGDFRVGDTVWLEHDGESGAGGRETLDLQDDGSMTGTFALNDVAGNAQAAVGDTGDVDREEGVATRVLYYAPNGDDGLRPATFRTSFMVDFDSSAVADKPWARGTPNEFATSFTVVEDTQHAYAIPELGATDEGNVRIKCEVATECTVYLECDDTAGNSRFGQLDDPIDGRSTLTLNAAAIADELDFGDDGWEGSLSCTVYSTREITVQVLVRSADVLVNQTYIEND